jgi:hypothetical protein
MLIAVPGPRGSPLGGGHYMDEYSAFVERVLTANAPGHIGDQDPETSK